MKEPYRSLFTGYEGHFLLGPLLAGDEPDWYGLIELHESNRWHALSSGERALVDFAAWLAGPYYLLDQDHRRRVLQALLATCDA